LDEEGVLAVAVLALPRHRVDLEAGIERERALREAVLEPRRALDHQHAPLPAGRIHEHAARVVLDDRLRFVRGNLGGVHRWRREIRRHDERRVHGRAVRGWNDPARIDDAAVGEEAELKRRAAESRADRRHVQIDRRVIELRIPGGHAEDLAVARAVGRPDADREDRRSARGGVGAGGPARVPAVGQDHNPRDTLTSVALANRVQRRGELGPPCIRGQSIWHRGAEAVADRIELCLEFALQRGEKLPVQQRSGARDARLAPAVGQPHAA
jgi:hypothetical protein